MDWIRLRELMLTEPKPPMSFVIYRRDPRTTSSARVLHDGDHKWLIWSSDKIEVNNGRRAVIVKNGGTEAHDATNLYSHGWIKSVVHPRLTNVGDEESEVEGRDISSVTTDQGECWRLQMFGLIADEPTAFTVDVDKVSGSFLRQRHLHVDAEMFVDELELEVALPPRIFEWMGE